MTNTHNNGALKHVFEKLHSNFQIFNNYESSSLFLKIFDTQKGFNPFRKYKIWDAEVQRAKLSRPILLAFARKVLEEYKVLI